MGPLDAPPVRRLLVVGTAAIVAAAILFAPVPLLEVRPAGTFSLGERLTVDGVGGEVLDGDYAFPAVAIREATLADAIVSWFRADIEVVPRTRFIPPGVDEAAYLRTQLAVFEAATDLAVAVGLDAAGVEVDFGAVTGGGVVVTAADGETAAVLRPGDVITTVDDISVQVLVDYTEAVDGRGTVELAVERDGEPRTVAAELPLDAVVDALPLRLALPVEVIVDGDGIGGPSAGLLTALTAYDLVDPVDLADGRLISGTGEVEHDGSVRRVGSVEEKVRAALAAGAAVFLVPSVHAADARDAVPAGAALEVIAVDTVAEAIAALGG